MQMTENLELELLNKITEFFLDSARKESFNGISCFSLLNIAVAETILRCALESLVKSGECNLAFASIHINPHIKRLPDEPIEKQIEFLKKEEINGICAYPSKARILASIDDSEFRDKPYSRDLLLGSAQLEYFGFELAVLERYKNDPSYHLQFYDYMGTMSVTDEMYKSEIYQDRDKVSLQTFGLGFDTNKNPIIVVFLRYLANLTAEHQQYWNSFRVRGNVLPSKQYYLSSYHGEFWENRSLRHAIVEEMRLINELTNQIWGKSIFREIHDQSGIIDLTVFTRPTSANFNNFVQCFDKMLSENIVKDFFGGKVELKEEIKRKDGNIEFRHKGSLRLLDEWLSKIGVWETKASVAQILKPLLEVRNLRQKPAHSLIENTLSQDVGTQRKQIMWDVFNSLGNIRHFLSKHPLSKEVEIPDWLDTNQIDVF